CARRSAWSDGYDYW
nr:immunoglobulin heavy chain junction region [Macaca mulatta]